MGTRFVACQVMLLISATFTSPAAFAGMNRVEEPGRVRIEPEVLSPGSSARVTYRNPSVKNQTVYIYYGFNGWDVPLSGAGAGQEVDTGNTNFFRKTRLQSTANAGEFQGTISIPSDAKAFHFVFCWNSCSPGQWDNSGNKDFNRPITFPYIGPLLTWNERTKADTGIVISFEHSTAGEGWLKYWKDPADEQRLKATGTGSMRRFQLTTLEPDTTYHYQVGIGSQYSSQVYSFKTLPQLDHLTRLSFLVFGDAQDNGESLRFTNVAQKMAEDHSDVQFVLSTGDLPWNDKPGDWWSFFHKAKSLFASKVVMPSIGNHDTPGTSSNTNHDSFQHYFGHPGLATNSAHYRFDVGPATFFAMNSERPTELRETGVQYKWLKRHLEAPDNRPHPESMRWRFAYWHISPFNAGNRHWRGQYVYRAPTLLFDQKIDWHFGGHEHLYQRMKPIQMASSQPVSVPEYGVRRDQGTGYLIVPSGGAFPESALAPTSRSWELRALLAYPNVPATVNTVEAFSGFSRVNIDGSHLSLQTISVVDDATQVIDEINYSK